MADDRSDSMSRLASRERSKSEPESESEPESQSDPESASPSDDTGETTEGSQSATDAEASGHPTADSADSPPAESATDPRSVAVKDRGSSLFMYLPQSLGNNIDLACQSVNLTYQRESGEKLGKNRYLYPIVLMVGVDTAVELDYEEIVDLVERVDEIEDGH